MREIIEIEGEQWELIDASGETDTDFWIAHGLVGQPNFGCIVSARGRQNLIDHIPESREKHRVGSIAVGMEASIVRSFKDVITCNRVNGYRKADDYAARQEKLKHLEALCADLWPWVFASESSQEKAS